MKFRIVSLGCPKNLVDSEYMAGRLETAGHELCDDAEVVVVNTCAFIADACSESIETILDEAKKGAGVKRLVVTGCLVERYGAELQTLLPEVDAFAVRSSYDAIDRIVTGKGYFKGETDEVTWEGGYLSRKVLTQIPTAYVKIQEGCNNRCSYCTIPSIRGGLKSRPVEDIKDELLGLLAKGYKEFNLIGQDTTSFGKDRGSSVKDLLRQILGLKGDFFVRLLYLHPKGIDDELLDIMSSDERIIPYLDVPIQHSEDRLLTSMNRGYGRSDLETIFAKIRNKMADAILRTTVMVGYPTETEEEFLALCNFITNQEFDNLGAFTYSREKGTSASRAKGHVLKSVKKARYNAIMELQKDISKRRLSRFVGRTMKVVAEEHSDDGGTTGRLIVQAPDVDGIAFIRGNYNIGQIVDCVVVKTLDYDVVVEVK
jgi:ribosomal protein S12 methylthiotransferase